jgi:glycosyltransferase involved in cell wall biosynthesis
MPDGNPWPRVSIVTPSYNQGRFIEETIRSTLLQGYPNLEYIIMDGGSTDNSVEIIKKYEKWLAYWVSEPDKGQSDAINKGWRLAKGDVLAYLNSDDIYMPGAVQTAAAFFSRNPGADMVYGECRIIDEHSRPGRRFRTADFRIEKVLCGGPCVIPQPSAFIRKAIIAQVGLMDVDMDMAMDLDLWVRIGLKHSIVRIPQVLSGFRLYPGTKTVSDASPFLPNHLAIVDKTFRDPALPERLKTLEGKARGIMEAQAAFQRGRLALIDGAWREARRSFTVALAKGSYLFKFAALIGLLCSVGRVDMEWLAWLLRKPRLR